MDDTDNRAKHNPFAPPATPVEDAAVEAGDPAGRGARLIATLLDALALGALTLAVGLFGSVTALRFAAASAMAYVVGFGVPFLLFIVLQAWLLKRRGQTLGKAAMQIRIVRTDGSRASLTRLLALRTIPMWLVMLVPVVGPLAALLDNLMIFRPSGRCLHDDVADTMVVCA
ncbi:RDD family protein [Ideonella sp. DXS29W]|uniref:RDD family protein n=1 Tax=Ideonella lacteola TaxID=2984193 RepID=A0ABU9BSB6_9BURK